jgi:hypothetical protein
MKPPPCIRAALRLLALLVVAGALITGGLFYMSRCGDAPPGKPAMKPSAEEITNLRDRLATHVRVLARDIGERNIGRPQAYQRAADYIAGVFSQAGYAVDWQRFEVGGVTCANLEATRAGGGAARQIVVVGAHYDSVYGCPGANDNGSGVAALLELARGFAAAKPARTVRFVAFANEEPPFFLTSDMGSRVYARECRKRGEDIRAMLSLETIGCYSDAPGSQHYPPLFNFFYPDRGNFIAFVGNFSARPLIRRAKAAFRSATDFPVETVTTFSIVPGVNWSDHDSFWREGYEAFMVTDTAPYRYAHYHEPADTPDKVDYEALARVTVGMEAVARDLAGMSE